MKMDKQALDRALGEFTLTVLEYSELEPLSALETVEWSTRAIRKKINSLN